MCYNRWQMRQALAIEILEALGLILVAVGLALWSLPVGLALAGVFVFLEARAAAQSLGSRPAESARVRAGIR